ncbi:hypothetical protein Y032_0016g2926 [Ancylostoma ceylanicum]|uniref:Uncharacterized protein n=1 Tax=Ancylostoma ceylanicum TaxID=53326 RepID=A0A016V6W1_9BILA|nr:hypothetical protein Y032_0016g2926 [Ancylostoma ceylanicum]
MNPEIHNVQAEKPMIAPRWLHFGEPVQPIKSALSGRMKDRYGGLTQKLSAISSFYRKLPTGQRSVDLRQAPGPSSGGDYASPATVGRAQCRPVRSTMITIRPAPSEGLVVDRKVIKYEDTSRAVSFPLLSLLRKAILWLPVYSSRSIAPRMGDFIFDTY